MIYFLAHRVLEEDLFCEYKDVFRKVESLCSTRLDGLLYQSDILRLTGTVQHILQNVYDKFSRHIKPDTASMRHSSRNVKNRSHLVNHPLKQGQMAMPSIRRVNSDPQNKVDYN